MIVSLNLQTYASYAENGDFDGMVNEKNEEKKNIVYFLKTKANYIFNAGVQPLLQSKACSAIVFASNTAHICVEKKKSDISLPVLHIADAIAIKAKKLSKNPRITMQPLNFTVFRNFKNWIYWHQIYNGRIVLFE